MKAVDADLHSGLTYRIRAEGSDPGVLQLFHVDPASGDLSMLKVLDFEELDDPEPTYTLTVEAVDQEGVMPPGLTSVTVTIKVGVPEHQDWDWARWKPNVSPGVERPTVFITTVQCYWSSSFILFILLSFYLYLFIILI